MTIIQILGLAIGLLTLLVSAELLRSAAARQRRPEVDATVGFRKVGTFGSLHQFGPNTLPIPSSGSATRSIFVVLTVMLFIGTGVVVHLAWEETHPDIRSAYGRAYERCVNEDGISRWQVQEVERCINTGRSAWQ